MKSVYALTLAIVMCMSANHALAETDAEAAARENAAAARADAEANRIASERMAAQAERDRIKERQGEREGGPGPSD